jgi:hypothetical protein
MEDEYTSLSFSIMPSDIKPHNKKGLTDLLAKQLGLQIQAHICMTYNLKEIFIASESSNIK